MRAAFGKAGANKAPANRRPGVLLLGAAALSLLLPRTWRTSGRPAAPAPSPASPATATPAPQPAADPSRAPRRMWALVQLRPEVMVLALSVSRAELERELTELNETWNHWELRVERQRYAIQAAPVLFQGVREPNAPVGPSVGSQPTQG